MCMDNRGQCRRNYHRHNGGSFRGEAFAKSAVSPIFTMLNYRCTATSKPVRIAGKRSAIFLFLHVCSQWCHPVTRIRHRQGIVSTITLTMQLSTRTLGQTASRTLALVYIEVSIHHQQNLLISLLLGNCCLVTYLVHSRYKIIIHG